MAPRLRRADCSGAGHPPPAARQGLRVPRRERASWPSPPCSSGSASSRSRPPGRTSGSARTRMGHIQATGTDAAGRKQYRYHDAGASAATARSSRRWRLRARPAAPAQARRAGPRSGNGMPREKVLAVRRAAARPRLLPDRLRGLRRGERHLRARDDEEAPRDRRRATRSASTTRPRAAAPRAGDRGPRGRADRLGS